ncbi:RELT-like protein 2 isoform X2 [Denticeps clupeoides]|uniref:RELT-like protein 2 isoform X2 n=1 Tax=Denticeps clupeoides TaxID=299321 RepID=UPI0010A434FB|nr:RELT-like protein 2 isoform X2 [Denticeps clupeoides]
MSPREGRLEGGGLFLSPSSDPFVLQEASDVLSHVIAPCLSSVYVQASADWLKLDQRGMTDQDPLTVGDPPPPYMIFLLVFFFFLTGLFGFLVCHMLKKKGYRCRAGEPDEEDEEEKMGPDDGDEASEDNQDTVEQILKCIMENEANMEAFKEMLGTQNVCDQHDLRLLRKESVAAIPPHHHTVHSGSDRNSCHLCLQSRALKSRRRSRAGRTRARPGEQTVFSVGRFRVTHMEKKNGLQGSTNLPAADSRDQLDQSEAPESDQGDYTKKSQGGFTLQNMFKDPAPGSTNGAVAKRKKSVSLFGLRRVSEPTASQNPAQEEPPTSTPTPAEESLDTEAPSDVDLPLDKGSPVTKDSAAEEVPAVKASPESPRVFSVVPIHELPEVPEVGEMGKDEMVEMEDIKDCRVSRDDKSLSQGHRKSSEQSQPKR